MRTTAGSCARGITPRPAANRGRRELAAPLARRRSGPGTGPCETPPRASAPCRIRATPRSPQRATSASRTGDRGPAGSSRSSCLVCRTWASPSSPWAARPRATWTAARRRSARASKQHKRSRSGVRYIRCDPNPTRRDRRCAPALFDTTCRSGTRLRPTIINHRPCNGRSPVPRCVEINP